MYNLIVTYDPHNGVPIPDGHVDDTVAEWLYELQNWYVVKTVSTYNVVDSLSKAVESGVLESFLLDKDGKQLLVRNSVAGATATWVDHNKVEHTELL